MPRQNFSADSSKPKQTLISNYFGCSSRIQILGQNKGKKHANGRNVQKMSNNNEDETVTIPFKIPCYITESDEDDFRSDSVKTQRRKRRSILSTSSEDKPVIRKSPRKRSPSKRISRKRSRARPIIETDSSSDVELVSYTLNETLSSSNVTIASGSDLAEDCHNKENQKVADTPKSTPEISIGVYSPLKKKSDSKLNESPTNDSAELVVSSDESTIITNSNVDKPPPQSVQNKPLISVKHISTLSNCQLSPIRNPGEKYWQASTSTINTSSPCSVLISKSTIEDNEETDNPISLNILLAIINFVVKHEHLQKLLIHKDTVMLNHFLQLHSEYIFFCLKLYTRIKKWYNIFDLRTAIKSKLSDPEVMTMYDCLKGSAFVDTDYTTEPIHDLLHHLHVKILRELCVEFKIPFVKVKKTDLVDKLLNNCNNQTTLTIKSSIRDLLMKSLKKKMGYCLKLNEYFFKLLNKVHLLYTYTTNEYIKTSDLYLFMSRIMYGSIVLPSYLIDRNVDIFRSVEEFNSFHEAFQCYVSVLIATDKKDSALIYQLADKSYVELKKIVDRNIVDNRPSYLHRFTPGHKYTKALWHAIPFIIRPHKELACEWLRFLLDQRLFCQYLRGAWFIQLTIIQTMHLKKYEEVTKTLIESLKDTSLKNIHRMELNKRAEKIKYNKACKISQIDFGKISSVQPLPLKDLPYREIDAQAFRSENSGQKRNYYIRIDSGFELYTVEEVALNYYDQNYGLNGIHCENSLLVTSFFLLFWDIIYDHTIPSVFVSEIQHYPLDLYSTEFCTNRKSKVNQRLSEVESEWTDAMMHQFICDVWNKNSQKKSFIHSSLVEEPERLFEMLMCIGRAKLRKIFEHFLEDFGSYRSGLPDLFLWNLDERKCKFVEVKGENDHLSAKQECWLDFLRSIGADVEVCYVHTTGSKRRKRSLDKTKDKSIKPSKKKGAKKQNVKKKMIVTSSDSES